MSLKRIILVAAAPVAIVAFTSPAAAQGIPVFDTSTYVQALAQVQNTIKMIQQGEQQIQTATTTLSSLQKLTNVNALAPQLLNAQVRNILPNTTIDASTLLSGDLSKIGFARFARIEHPVSLRAAGNVVLRRRPSLQPGAQGCDQLIGRHGRAGREYAQHRPDPDARPRPAPRATVERQGSQGRDGPSSPYLGRAGAASERYAQDAGDPNGAGRSGEHADQRSASGGRSR